MHFVFANITEKMKWKFVLFIKYGENSGNATITEI